MNLVRVYISTDRFQFEQVKIFLEDEEIPFKFRNSVDSMYNNFGTFEIFVDEKDSELASEKIKQTFG
jgi:hypothetical protein